MLCAVAAFRPSVTEYTLTNATINRQASYSINSRCRTDGASESLVVDSRVAASVQCQMSLL